MIRDNRHFRRFQTPTFTCQTCARRTRDTGQGVDHLCADCFELAGMDNHCNDNAVSPAEAGYLDEMHTRLCHIAKLGGNVKDVVRANSFLWPKGFHDRPVPAFKPRAPKAPKAKPVPPTPEYMIPVVEATPAGILERTRYFMSAAQAMINDYFARNYPRLSVDQLELSLGQRYAKIISRNTAQGSVWAFVDLQTGDIYKPASFRAPAKHARGTVLAANYGVECCTSHGPRYL